jgi:hypothetical protein
MAHPVNLGRQPDGPQRKRLSIMSELVHDVHFPATPGYSEQELELAARGEWYTERAAREPITDAELDSSAPATAPRGTSC